MTILFKCDKVIRSIKNKIVKKGERKSMKKRKYLALLLAAGMIVQTALSTGGVVQVQAAEDTYVKTDELTDNDTAAPKKDKTIPSKNQYEYQKQELAAFCHFGPNTFNEIEWGEHYGDKTPNEIFKLTEDFDADTLVKTLKEAGFKKLIVTAKHHDGFCIWASEATQYDVSGATNYQGGKGDVLADISKACTEHDMDMGLYLSPWDIHDESYGYKDASGKALVEFVDTNNDGKPDKNQPVNGLTWEQVKQQDAKDYNKYYNDQLIEILGNDKYGNKGHFKEVWMDGAKGSGAGYQEYDFKKWFDTIQQYEGIAGNQVDDCMLFGAEAYTTVRWIGNENGFAAEETWSKSNVDKAKNTINSNSSGGYTKGFPDGNQWTVPEADARITSGWFWGDSKKTPKTMEELSEMYFRSVGHNAPLLLNVPPNNKGKVDDAILRRVTEFGTAINKTFEKNLAKDAEVSATEVRGKDTTYSPQNVLDGKDDTYWTVNDETKSGTLLIDLKKDTLFDVVSIEESIEFGQRIGKFKVEYQTANGEWKKFDEGTTVGAKRLSRRSPVKSSKIRITVTAHESAENKIPMISEVGVYKAAAGMEAPNGIPEGLQVVDDRAFTADGWSKESGDQFIEGTGMWCRPNAEATVKFTGTKVWLVGTIDPSHGPADVYIDGNKVASINTKSDKRKLQQRIFESDTLKEGKHTLKIVNTGTGTEAIGVDAALVLNNGGKGMFQIEYPSYRVNENTKTPIMVKRLGGTKGEATVQFQVNPGSAWQDHFNADGNMELKFADGQTEAQAHVETRRVPGETGDLSFTAVLADPTNGTIIGFNNPATVTIADSEQYTKEKVKEKLAQIEKAGYNEAQYTSGSWEALQAAIKDAKAVMEKTNAGAQDYAEACTKLEAALNSLTKRSTYTDEDRFIMPRLKGRTKQLEAEHFILDKGTSENGKHVRLVADDKASNGQKVGWFEKGNIIKVPFHADKAGTYTFKATYQSGRLASGKQPNSLNWSGKNVTAGSKADIYGTESNGTKYETLEFDVEITAAGDGELIFTADDKGSPNLDKFEVTAKEVPMEKYTITSSVAEGEQGTISPLGAVEVEEGSSKEFEMKPNEGYAVKDVVVDGKSVGSRTKYTFEEVLANGHTITATFEKEMYAEDNRFEFPVDGNAKTLEAERLEAKNVEDPSDGQWKMEVKEADWASGGKFVNSMNKGDTLTLYYNAPQAGEYTVTLSYRSGSTQNGFKWAEKDGKIEAGEVTAGASSADATHTKEFKLNVKTAGEGCLVFTAFDTKAPQLDKFDIKSPGTPVPPISAVELEAAVKAAKGLDLNDYKDDDAKTAFTAKLAEAEKLLADIAGGSFAGTQDEVNQMAKELKAAQDALNEKEQTPQVNKDTLKEAIGKAEALDLTQYKEEGKAEFNAALQNAKAVLEKADADQDEIDQATLALNTAIQNLKPVDGGSGDGNGEGNGNGSTGGNGNGSGSTGGSGNGSGNTGGNGSTGGSGTGNSAVQTGDSSNLFVYAGTLLLAAAAFVFGFRRRNQEK